MAQNHALYAAKFFGMATMDIDEYFVPQFKSSLSSFNIYDWTKLKMGCWGKNEEALQKRGLKCDHKAID